jgi:hypothetical protein
LKEFLEIFNRPFPLIESVKEKLILSLVFGFSIFMFLWIFQPFGLDQTPGEKVLYLSGYGFITTIVILFNIFIATKIFKNFFL